MARRIKREMKSSFFHIMTQGINKEYIFNSDKDKAQYLKFINSNEVSYNIETIVHCIMNNHAHLIIKIEKIADMTKFMHKINTLYALYYNKKYNRVGYVFRDRYKSQPINSEKQMYTCINYIHNNPVKAKICKTPDEYKFSSFKNYNNISKKFNIPDDNKDIYVLEVEEQIDMEIMDYIEIYLNNNNINMQQLRADKTKLIELIKKLKNKYNVSLRKMEKYIGISRETIRKIMVYL